MSERFVGKVAVVTGGASGIAAATVRRFVAEGAVVVIADRQADSASALADELGHAAMPFALDVTDYPAVEALRLQPQPRGR